MAKSVLMQLLQKVACQQGTIAILSRGVTRQTSQNTSDTYNFRTYIFHLYRHLLTFSILTFSTPATYIYFFRICIFHHTVLPFSVLAISSAPPKCRCLRVVGCDMRRRNNGC